MKVTEQIDALEAVAVDSFKFLAVTRIVACIIAMPLLTTIMDFCGIVGGFVAETRSAACRGSCISTRVLADRVQRLHSATHQDAVFG
jgi:ABC-type transporter Mla maintaining outer membrane lipid asymmetry permease subunit MlaE